MGKLDIELSDLSENQREIAETIGLDNFFKLSKRFGGEDSLYIPKYSELVKISKRKEILRDYNGHNILELARKYNYSERYIRKIVRE